MNTRDAMYRLVHEYPGGAEALGSRVDMRVGVLRNKANPNSTTNFFTIDEMIRLCQVANDFRPLAAMNAELGHTCTKLEDACADDKAVLEIIASMVQSQGDVAGEVCKALEDGRIEPHEVAAVAAKVRQSINISLQLVERLGGMCEKERA